MFWAALVVAPLIRAQVAESVLAETCTACSIELVHVVSLRETVEAPFLESTMVLADSRGGYIVGPLVGRTQFAVYSPEGRLVRVVGAPGSGPGEFRRCPREIE